MLERGLPQARQVLPQVRAREQPPVLLPGTLQAWPHRLMKQLALPPQPPARLPELAQQAPRDRPRASPMVSLPPLPTDLQPHARTENR